MPMARPALGRVGRAAPDPSRPDALPAHGGGPSTLHGLPPRAGRPSALLLGPGPRLDRPALQLPRPRRGDGARRRRRPGYFGDAFEARAPTTSPSTPTSVSSPAGLDPRRTVIGDGMRLPFRDDAVDVCYSSNVPEHVPEPWRMADEILRVTRPGGLVYISYTVWFGPGAARRPRPGTTSTGRRAGRATAGARAPNRKNEYGESLFPVTWLVVGLDPADGDVPNVNPELETPVGQRCQPGVPPPAPCPTWKVAIEGVRSGERAGYCKRGSRRPACGRRWGALRPSPPASPSRRAGSSRHQDTMPPSWTGPAG